MVLATLHFVRKWREADVRPECHAATNGERAEPGWENHNIEVQLTRAERQRRFDQIADGVRALGLHVSNAELRVQVDSGKLHKRHAFRPHIPHARWHDGDADGGGDIARYVNAKEPWFLDAYRRAWLWADSTGWRPQSGA